MICFKKTFKNAQYPSLPQDHNESHLIWYSLWNNRCGWDPKRAMCIHKYLFLCQSRILYFIVFLSYTTLICIHFKSPFESILVRKPLTLHNCCEGAFWTWLITFLPKSESPRDGVRCPCVVERNGARFSRRLSSGRAQRQTNNLSWTYI